MTSNANPLTPDLRISVSLAQTGDALLAVLFTAAIVVEIWVFGGDGLGVGQRVIATVLAPMVALPIAVRSVVPLSALVVNSIATIGMVTFSHDSDIYQWPNLLLLFTVAVAHIGWESWLGLLMGLGGVAYYFATFRFEGTTTAIAVLSLWLVVWLVGRVQGSRVEKTKLRTDRDLAAELAAARQERLELEAQRTNMARELHDLIGHTVNVMVVHAGAGRRAVRSDPDGAEQAFATIETTGRSALEELDRVLGLLRSDDMETPLAPLPGLNAVPDLLQEFERAGLSVRLSIHGAIDAVPEGLGLTAYRVIQEALTNTMKHSDAATADVWIRVGPAEVQVVVTDPGPGRASVAGVGGRGLAGISERVQLHGGKVTFGPIDGAGFRVDSTLPLIRTEVSP